ncbi:MAG: neutral/alkaline non-lysosomal ceramidase N-terminal domain-containing protein [Prosthecobacter sp.]
MKVIFALVFLFVAVVSDAQTSTVFKAGAATSNITPDIGGPIVGGFSPFPSTHIHDELHARCLVLENGDKRIAIVVCDLLGAARQMFDEAARLVKEETGLPREALLLSCTHTHSASSALSDNRYDTLSMDLTAYQKFVARRIADGVKRAINNLEPAKIGWATASVPGQVFNRRWFMKEGTVPPNPFGGIDKVKMNPGHSANLVKPAGPTDPEVCLLAVQSTQGRWISVLGNYSLHYVGGVGSGHVSADYFAMFCDRVERLLGAEHQEPPFVGLLSNGTSGNINNNDYGKPPGGPRLAPYERMRQVADEVALAAVDALKKVRWQDAPVLDARFAELRVAQRRPDAEQIAWAEKTKAAGPRLGDKTGVLSMAYAERFLKLKDAAAEIDLPLQAIRIGGVAITGIPCETFVETGLELKEKNPFKPSWTHSIAGGYFGYLPTPEHHDLGGYETWLGTNRVEKQGSVKITAKLLEMLAEMKKD